MENIRKKFGLISLIGTVIAIIITYFMSIAFGVILYIICFALAAIDLYKSFKAEGLTPKEFLAVAVKENLFSVITVGAVVVVAIVWYFASLKQDFSALTSIIRR